MLLGKRVQIQKIVTGLVAVPIACLEYGIYFNYLSQPFLHPGYYIGIVDTALNLISDPANNSSLIFGVTRSVAIVAYLGGLILSSALCIRTARDMNKR